MCTPFEPYTSLASIAAAVRPPGVATSVLVTYMSAHEQSRTLEAIAMRDFILFSAGAPALFRSKGGPFSRYLMQLSCRSAGKNRTDGCSTLLRQSLGATWPD